MYNCVLERTVMTQVIQFFNRLFYRNDQRKIKAMLTNLHAQSKT